MSFRFTDVSGDHLTVEPGTGVDDMPVVAVTAEQHRDAACVHIPLDHVEEFIAGVRDAAGQPKAAEEPPMDPAAFYRELADKQEQIAATDVIRRRRSIATARRLFAVELRRMADEAQQDGAQP